MGGGDAFPRLSAGADVWAALSSLAAPRGKRGWKPFHAILKGMILYLQKVGSSGVACVRAREGDRPQPGGEVTAVPTAAREGLQRTALQSLA